MTSKTYCTSSWTLPVTQIQSWNRKLQAQKTSASFCASHRFAKPSTEQRKYLQHSGSGNRFYKANKQLANSSIVHQKHCKSQHSIWPRQIYNADCTHIKGCAPKSIDKWYNWYFVAYIHCVSQHPIAVSRTTRSEVSVKASSKFAVRQLNTRSLQLLSGRAQMG